MTKLKRSLGVVSVYTILVPKIELLKRKYEIEQWSSQVRVKEEEEEEEKYQA